MSLNTVENKSIVCRLLQKRVGRKGLLILRLFQRHWHIRRRERRAFAFLSALKISAYPLCLCRLNRVTQQLQKNLPNLPLFIGESGVIVVRQIDLAGTSGGFEDLEKSTAALQLHCGLDNTCEDLLLPMIVV